MPRNVPGRRANPSQARNALPAPPEEERFRAAYRLRYGAELDPAYARVLPDALRLTPERQAEVIHDLRILVRGVLDDLRRVAGT